MKCRDCGQDFTCPEHGEPESFEDMGDWFIFCGGCVEKYGTALGAIMHATGCAVPVRPPPGVMTLDEFCGGET